MLGQEPGNIEARLGRAAAKAGDRREAAREYARILQVVPTSPRPGGGWPGSAEPRAPERSASGGPRSLRAALTMTTDRPKKPRAAEAVVMPAVALGAGRVPGGVRQGD